MRKRDKEVLQHLLREEDGTLKSLEKAYRQAMDEIDERIAILRADEMTQSKIYQLKYQRALRSQVERIVDKLQGNAYKTVEDYLRGSYRDGFVGTMYALHGQKLPILSPIDKNAVEKAVRVDSALSESLYETMRVDMRKLKRAIRTEISVGISTGKTFDEMASAIERATNVPLNRTKTIVRTEGHRIQQASAADARNEAKRQGCDVLKQWDSTLDGNTRPTHRALDGQIRETNEPFEVDGKQADRPGEFGRPEEDCNCRCVALTRARWGLGKDELHTLQERAKFFSLDKEDNFQEFSEKYLKAAEEEVTIESVKAIQFGSGDEANKFFYYDDYDKSHGLMARKNSQHGKWQSGLSADENDCICDYTGGGYYDLNNYLRQVGDWQSIDAAKENFIAQNLDSAISRYELKDTISVQRGVMTDVIDRLAEEHNIQNSLSELVGKKYIEKGYSSTTVLHGNGVATAKPVVFDIEIPSGTGRGAYINQLAGQYQDVEYEFLIKRGASFTIKEVVEEEFMGEYHYYMKLVMDVE